MPAILTSVEVAEENGFSASYLLRYSVTGDVNKAAVRKELRLTMTTDLERILQCSHWLRIAAG